MCGGRRCSCCVAGACGHKGAPREDADLERGWRRTGTSALQGPDGADVWVGAWTLPPERRGLVVLGTPVGHANFVQDCLQQKRAEHQRLLDRIPCVPDLQAAWLLLLFCARPRCNYLLRALPPAETAAYAAGHDDALAACLSHLLAGVGADGCTVPEGAELGVLQLRRAQLPLVHGGLGLRAARSERFAAHWASWADSLPVLRERLPALGADLLAALSAGGGGLPCAAHAVRAALTLPPGFTRPTWQELWDGVAPGRARGFPPRMAKRGHHADRRGGARHAVFRP